jgi:sugar-specific transcriptional regulator TrmB
MRRRIPPVVRKTAMDTSPLKEIGMNDAEIRIYTTLISYGTLSAKEIADRSGLYRPYVYDNLAKLIEKGLVTHYRKPKKAYYQAVNPDRITDILDHKVETVREIVDQLKEKYLRKKAEYDVQIYEGADSLRIFYEEIYTILKDGKSDYLLVLGGTGEASAHVENYFSKLLMRGVRDRLYEELDIRMIYNSNSRESDIPKHFSAYLDIRFSPPEDDCAVTTIITDAMVATMDLIDRPFVLCSYNRHFIETQKRIFTRLWATYED